MIVFKSVSNVQLQIHSAVAKIKHHKQCKFVLKWIQLAPLKTHKESHLSFFFSKERLFFCKALKSLSPSSKYIFCVHEFQSLLIVKPGGKK